MKIYSDLTSMEIAVAAINARDAEVDRIAGLCDIAYQPGVGEMSGTDPFSPEYRDMVVEIYKVVSRRADYDPRENELSPYIANLGDQPGYYKTGSTAFVGEVLTAMGQVLAALDARPGDRIIEFGAGEGGIALEAAKAGCDVTVVDIEPMYLEVINRRAQAQGLTVKTILGEFGCDCGGSFDRILFYEAFHHALDHQKMASRLPAMLAPGGFMVLAGEPVIGSHNEQWRPTLPYPWGLRLDGLSFRAIQAYGWMELGFDQDYFVEMLMRAGFLVTYRSCAMNERGAAYIARPFSDQLNMGDDFLLSNHWHPREAEYRWTAVDEAVLPMCVHKREVTITIANFSPYQRHFEIESGGATRNGTLHYGDQCVVTLPPANRIYFRTKAKADVGTDGRKLGLAVKSVAYL